jgi:hypothetical protein
VPSSSSCRPHPVIAVSAWSSLSIPSRCRWSLLSPPTLSLCTAMLLTAPVLPASRGSQRQVWVLGNGGVGARHGCCFEKRGGQRWLLGGCGWCVPYGYLIGWASPLSSQPVVVILVLLSPSHPFGWGGGDARFGRPSWVGTK